jgi:hypothetical protein
MRFLTSGFFMNQISPSPEYPIRAIKFFFLLAEIFAALGALLVSLTPGANLPPMSLIPVANCHWCHWYRQQIWHRRKFSASIIDTGGKFTKMGTNVFFKSTNCKSANSWAQFAIKNPQILETCEFANFISVYLFWLIWKSQICKFCRWASPLIANPQIFHHKTERMKHLFSKFPHFTAKLSKSRLLVCLAKFFNK